jgi:hypothetical protein
VSVAGSKVMVTWPSALRLLSADVTFVAAGMANDEPPPPPLVFKPPPPAP